MHGAATASPRPSVGCASMAALRHPDDPLLVRFLPLYYSELPEGDVDDRKLDDIYAVAVAHLALGRRPGAGRGPGPRAVARTASATAGTRRTRCCSSSPTTCRSSSTRCGWSSTATASASTCSSTRCWRSSRDAGRRARRRRRPLGAGEGAVEAWTQIEIDRIDDEPRPASSRPTIARAPSRTSGGSSPTSPPMRDRMARRSAASTRSCRGWPTASSCSSARPTTTSTPDGAARRCATGSELGLARGDPRAPRPRPMPGERPVVIARTDDTSHGLPRRAPDRRRRRAAGRRRADAASSACWPPTPTASACSTSPASAPPWPTRLDLTEARDARPHRPGDAHRAREPAPRPGAGAGRRRRWPGSSPTSSGCRSASWCACSRCPSPSGRGSRCSSTCRATGSRPSCPSASPTPSPTAYGAERAHVRVVPRRQLAGPHRASACAAPDERRAGRPRRARAGRRRAVDVVGGPAARGARRRASARSAGAPLFERVGAHAPAGVPRRRPAATGPIGDVRRIAALLDGDDELTHAARPRRRRAAGGVALPRLPPRRRRRRCPSCCRCSTTSGCRPSTSSPYTFRARRRAGLPLRHRRPGAGRRRARRPAGGPSCSELRRARRAARSRATASTGSCCWPG